MLDLALKIHEQILDFWKFFVPSAIALLGWIFSLKKPWSWTERIAVAIAFVGFAVFNLVGLIQSYGTLETLVTELRASSGVAGLTIKAFEAMVARLDMGWRWKIGIAFHCIVDVGVLIFILWWAGRKDTPQEESTGVKITDVKIAEGKITGGTITIGKTT